MIKINHKVFSIPPYISTSWNKISTLRKKDSDLLVTLLDGTTIEIPNLEEEVLYKIFEIHSSMLDNSLDSPTLPSFTAPSTLLQTVSSSSDPIFDQAKEGMIKFSIGSVGDFAGGMQHNPELKDAPEIPEEILEKIVSITKKIVSLDAIEMPKAEESCNCVHCQISRALNKACFTEENQAIEELVPEEMVEDSELTFSQWNVIASGKNLCHVVNKLDEKEQFTVFLDDPIGCTCGCKNCEHIVAALRS